MLAASQRLNMRKLKKNNFLLPSLMPYAYRQTQIVDFNFQFHTVQYLEVKNIREKNDMCGSWFCVIHPFLALLPNTDSYDIFLNGSNTRNLLFLKIV
jgi:hypothetical protein